MSTHLPVRRLFATALLSAAVATAVTGCGGDASSTAAPAPVVELSASATPAERLEAAVVNTLTAGPIRVSSVANGIETENQLDYSKRVTYSSMENDASSPVSSVFMRDNVVYVRFAEDTNGAKAGTWYRAPADEGMTRMLAKSFDIDWVKKVIVSSTDIVENGTEDVNGSQATHFVVTPDRDVMVDLALQAIPDALVSSGTVTREALASQVPAELHYWVSDAGYLVKEDDGSQVKTYFGFGEPLDLPEFDEAAVDALPGA